MENRETVAGVLEVSVLLRRSRQFLRFVPHDNTIIPYSQSGGGDKAQNWLFVGSRSSEISLLVYDNYPSYPCAEKRILSS